jgi:chemosensory pili system protein ChpA (sensor histidine kinase/response regulator)
MVGHTVLTVDDDLATRRLMKIVLELDGMNVIEATDGFDCIDKVQHEQIDLILLDINMPGLTGWEVLRALRGNSKTAHIPTIIVSGESPDHRLMRELNPTAFIRKPFDIEDLAIQVKDHLKRAASERNCA